MIPEALSRGRHDNSGHCGENNDSPKSNPAYTMSRKGLGCIMFFVGHLKKWTENGKRKDIENVEAYHKNGIFEELCHLVSLPFR